MDFLHQLPWWLCAVLAVSLAVAVSAWWQQRGTTLRWEGVRQLGAGVAEVTVAVQAAVAGDVTLLNAVQVAAGGPLAQVVRDLRGVLGVVAQQRQQLSTCQQRFHANSFLMMWVATAVDALAEGGLFATQEMPTEFDAHPDAEFSAAARGLMAGIETIQQRALQDGQDIVRHAIRLVLQRVQGGASRVLEGIQNLQRGHADLSPKLVDALDGLDMEAAELHLRIQSAGVGLGATPGHARGDHALHDIVRAAEGRVAHYRRVVEPPPSEIVVRGRAVEPVTLALSLLLDNALRYSAPDVQVFVTFRNTSSGVAIVVDDSGKSMSDDRFEHANAMLRNGAEVSLADVGDPPRFGLAVVSALAGRYGFAVQLAKPSPFGGITAVLHMPDHLLGDAAAAPVPDRVPAAIQVAPQLGPDASTAQHRAAEDHPESQTKSGLPVRQRRRTPPPTIAPVLGPACEQNPPPARAGSSPFGTWQRARRDPAQASPAGPEPQWPTDANREEPQL